MIDFSTSPDQYKHWTIDFDGPVATLTMDVAEDGGLVPGYDLKLNSYDLGVDIELHDAIQRLRFEHPEVKSVIMTSAKDRVFCAGANISMLGTSSHAHKVNFCKFTNETRNGIEDATKFSDQRYICLINGTAAGGGYGPTGERPREAINNDIEAGFITEEAALRDYGFEGAGE